jgi:hypothetical protein
MQEVEAQVLELVVERVQSQAVGDRRVDVQRFARDSLLLLHRHGIERAHVVQPVGELDEDHAHVARHREQHLAEVLGLRVLQRGELDAVDLRHAIDQLRHGLAEALRDLGLGGGRVLDDVVQDRGHQRLRIEVPLREDLRDRERMRDVRLAALAVLAGMRRARDLVRLLDLRDVLGLEVAQDFGELLRPGAGKLRGGSGGAGPDARYDSTHDAEQGHGPLPGVRYSQDRRRGSRRIQQLLPHFSGGDLAQRDHGGLVLVGLDHRRRPERDLARAVRRGERQLETIG